MEASVAHRSFTHGRGDQAARSHRLEEVIGHAAHVLPAQGPITVFIHHNTLHAFEDLPFHEAVKKGAQVFGCHPYLSEDRYREALARADPVFRASGGARARPGRARRGADPLFRHPARTLRLAMLQYPLRTGPTEELVWYVAEANALRRVRSEVSSAVRARLIAETRRWVMRDLRGGNGGRQTGAGRVTRVSGSLAELLDRFGETRSRPGPTTTGKGSRCRLSGGSVATASATCRRYTKPPPPPVRQRDLLLEATGVDTDAMVHDVLIRFCAAFLDQGMANWQLPRRTRDSTAPSARSTAIRAGAGRLDARAGPGAGPARGRAGRTARFDPGIARCAGRRRGGVGPFPLGDAAGPAGLGGDGPAGRAPRRPRGSADPGGESGRVSWRSGFCSIGSPWPTRPALPWEFDAPVREFWRLARGKDDPHWPPSVEQRAFLVFQLAQVLGLSPDVLYRLSKPEWATLLQEIESFTAARAAARSFTWPTSGGSRPRRSMPLPCTRDGRRAGRIAPVPGGLLPRRARGVVPPPPGGAGSRCRDIRRGRVLHRGDVLQGGGRRALHAALPGGDPARNWVTEEVVDRAGRGAPPPGADPPGIGNGVAPVSRRQPRLRAGRGLDRGTRACWRRFRWWPASSSRASPRGSATRSAGSSRPRR